MIDLQQQITQQEFGQLVGVAQQTVSEMLARGVINQGGTAHEWLQSYCAHLREVAAGRAAEGGVDLAHERALLARAQRERIEVQLAEKRRELVPAYLLEEVLAKTAARIAAIFDGIPGAIKRRVPYMPTAGLDLVRGEIVKARNIVAAMTLDDVIADDERDDDTPADLDDDAADQAVPAPGALQKD